MYSITSVLQNLNYHEEMIPYLHRLAELEPDSLHISTTWPMPMTRRETTEAA